MNETTGKWIILASCGFNCALAIIVAFVPILQFLMGRNIWIIQVPLLVGALLMGLAVMEKEKWFTPKQTRNLIAFAALIGYTNFIGLIGAGPFFDEKQSNSAISRGTWRILIWPLLIQNLCFTLFIPMFEDRVYWPIIWHGRYGLTLIETLWDHRLFWAEFGYSIMLIVAIIGLLWWRFPYIIKDQSPESQKQMTRIGKLGLGIAIGIVAIMLFFIDSTYPIWPNSFSTQFAYEIISWPSMLLLGALIFIDHNRKPSNTIHLKMKNRPIIAWFPVYLCAVIFLIIWLVRSTATEYHPFVIFSFKTPIYILIMTGFVLFPILAFCIRAIFATHQPDINETSRILSDENSNEESHNKDSKTIFMQTIVLTLCFLLTLGFIVFLQYYADNQTPAVGSESLFSTDLPWWWLIAHWPSFAFIISASLGGYVLLGNIVQKSHLNLPKTNSALSSKESNDSKRSHNTSRSLPKIHAILLIGMISLLSITTWTQIQAEWDRRDAPMLLINQVGYFPNAPKRVLFQWQGNVTFDAPIPYAIYLTNASTPLHEGLLEIGPQRYGYTYLIGNFTNLTTLGNYYIRCEYKGVTYKSYDFAISDNILDDALEWQYRFFYYQRCNYKVENVVPGYIGHEACHLDDAEVFTGTEWVHKDLTGGWHDAGDYNKYNSWFQTQWYCTQALAEASLINANNFTAGYASLYDSELPDAIDEALWGMKFLLNCINVEGYQGEANRYRIWVDVLGYRHQSEREARMSYGGPPEYDWTTPRRVPFKENNSTFTGIGTGYLFAGTLMQMARLIDEAKIRYPNTEWPTWVTTNTTEIRRLAGLVYDTHYAIEQAQSAEHFDKLLYIEEYCRWINNWSLYDAAITAAVPRINALNTYPLWFTWAGAYYFGSILMHYITTNRPLPLVVQAKIAEFQTEQFSKLFDDPFLIKHTQVDGQNVLFYGAERHTDILTSAWLQALICKLAPEIGKPQLVQSMLDWLFGMNPSGYSFVEGMGDRFTPNYHHRYISAKNPTGAVPGAIPNGVGLFQMTKTMKTRNNITSDLEQLQRYGDMPKISDFPASLIIKEGADVNPNEVWIPYNAMAIKLFTMILK